MAEEAGNPVIEAVRRALGRTAGAAVEARPEVLAPRPAGPIEAEIELLIKEINALSGSAQRVSGSDLNRVLKGLLETQEIKKATLWQTAGLVALDLEGRLQELGVEIISPHADKYTLAACDLGVTEVDFALPETGTLGLLSSREKPRVVSLLPRVHLAILRPAALRADLHDVFAEAKDQGYLILITGPSRTADIELTVTLGVHGPQSLHVWVYSE
jgi:L-lactate dehydrogenase complex protein LldG